MVKIVPHRKRITVESTVGECVGLDIVAEFIADRHPIEHTLVVTVGIGSGVILGDGLIDLGCVVIETLAGFDAGDEEVFIFPCLAVYGDCTVTAVPRLDIGVELR